MGLKRELTRLKGRRSWVILKKQGGENSQQRQSGEVYYRKTTGVVQVMGGTQSWVPKKGVGSRKRAYSLGENGVSDMRRRWTPRFRNGKFGQGEWKKVDGTPESVRSEGRLFLEGLPILELSLWGPDKITAQPIADEK